jgi:large subunit ribosomal protein L29
MPKTSFHDLDDGALIDQVTDAKDQLFKLRFQLATGQLSNYARIGQVRKDIARLETELRAREIAAAEALAPEAEPTGEDGARAARRHSRQERETTQRASAEENA